jgi:hypothetical protein
MRGLDENPFLCELHIPASGMVWILAKFFLNSIRPQDNPVQDQRTAPKNEQKAKKCVSPEGKANECLNQKQDTNRNGIAIVEARTSSRKELIEKSLSSKKLIDCQREIYD